MADRDEVRYGVFLLPDARTSAAVTAITGCLRAQFGLVSAGRFPPHVTLAGSLPLAVAEADLLDAVRQLARRHEPVPVTDVGPRRLRGSALVLDVHEDAHGRPNEALLDLAVDVMDVVRPLLGPARHLAADLREREDWHGHLSLASHELVERPELIGEVEEFVRELDEPYPARFTATRLAVVRLHHPDWARDWWTGFSWELVRSFSLGAGAAPAGR